MEIKEKIINALKATNRAGMDNVISYLEKSSFFTDPASCNNHYNFAGGLAKHSYNVMRSALALRKAFIEAEPTLESKLTENKIIVTTLLHDICKTGKYKIEKKNKKNLETGKWEVVDAYVIGNDKFQLRKPDQHCFNYVKKKFLDNMDKFIYIGDAAGRINDFSNSDIMFAKNIKSTGINISFLTPEEYFENKQYGIYPDEIIASEISKQLFRSDIKIVLLSGFPCAGKSFISHLFAKDGWKIVSKDVLKSKCEKEFIKYLSLGNKVVVDNTNLTIKDRDVYKFKDYKRACVVIKTNIETCSENEILRTMEDPNHNSISPIVYKKMRKIFQEVSEDEFDKIYKL